MKFDFAGIETTTGNRVQGTRQASDFKALRSALRRDRILVTSATEKPSLLMKLIRLCIVR